MVDPARTVEELARLPAAERARIRAAQARARKGHAALDDAAAAKPRSPGAAAAAAAAGGQGGRRRRWRGGLRAVAAGRGRDGPAA